MIGAGNEEEVFGFGGVGDNLLKLGGGRKLVVVATEKELGNLALAQAGVPVFLAIGLGRQAQRGEGTDGFASAAAAATGAERDCRAEAESDGHDRAIVFVFKPVQRGQHVACFGLAVVGAVAEARAAKVEPQNRPGKPPCRLVESLHRGVNHFVVHGAAEEGVGMADQRGKRCVGIAFIQKGFEAARGTFQVDVPQP